MFFPPRWKFATTSSTRRAWSITPSIYCYLEHARHQFLKAHGLDFAEITASGVTLVVTHIELDYIRVTAGAATGSGVTAAMHRVSRVRWGFRQEISRFPDNKLMLRAYVVGTSLNHRRRPCAPAIIDRLSLTSVHRHTAPG